MPDIQHVVYIEDSFEKIFQMFSTREGLKIWWTPDVKGGEGIGDVFTFGFGEEGEAKFEIIESMPPEYLKWVYKGESTDEWYNTEIVVHLSASGKEVKVLFQHNGFVNNNYFFDACETTWKRLLTGLKHYCEEGKAPALDFSKES